MNTKTKIVAFLVMFSVLAIVAVFVVQASIKKGYVEYLKGVDVVDFTIDSSGRIWVLERKERSQQYPSGAYIIRVQEHGSWTTYSPDDYLPEGFTLPKDNHYLSSLVVDTKGNIWIGTSDFGLIKIDGENWKTFTTQNSGLASNESSNVSVDNQGRVWITYFTENSPGVTVFDGSNWTTYNTDNSGLPSNGVYGINFDNNNRAWFRYSPWVKPSPGVTVFDGSTWTTYNTDNSGLPSNDIYTIAFDSGGKTWLGTKDGLSIFDGKEWVAYTSKNSEQIVGTVRYIKFDNKDRAWILNKNNNQSVIVLDGQKRTQYSLDDMGFKNDFTLYLCIDQSGRTWVWNKDEVRILDNGKWIGIDELNITPINFISIDEQGKIWIVKNDNKGLVVFDKDYPFSSAKLSYIILRISQAFAVILLCLTLAAFFGTSTVMIVFRYFALMLAFIIPLALFTFGGFYAGFSWGMRYTDYPLVETWGGAFCGGVIGILFGVISVVFLKRRLFPRILEKKN